MPFASLQITMRAISDYLPSPTQIASYLVAFGTLSQKALNTAASAILIKNTALGE